VGLKPQAQTTNSVFPAKKPKELQRKTSSDVRQYIEKLIQEAKLQGKDYID
jgi:hypothetical protein